MTKGMWGEVPADAWKIIVLFCPVPKMKYILYFKISTQLEQIFGRPKIWGLRSNTCLTCGLKHQFWQRREKKYVVVASWAASHSLFFIYFLLQNSDGTVSALFFNTNGIPLK